MELKRTPTELTDNEMGYTPLTKHVQWYFKIYS